MTRLKRLGVCCLHKHGRIDANQNEIVDALRRCGATVWVTSDMGQGAPDLVVGFNGANYLLEVKVLGGTLTKDEAHWHATWRGDVIVVHSADEALMVIGAI